MGSRSARVCDEASDKGPFSCEARSGSVGGVNDLVEHVDLRPFDRLTLAATGRYVHLAPGRPIDLEAVRRFFEALDDRSSYLRFLGVRHSIPERDLTMLATTMLPRRVVMLAWMGGRVTGVGDLHVRDDPTEAEVAFAVSDAHHGEGIGTLLLEDLAVIARCLGVRRLCASTFAENREMQLVFRTAGVAERHHLDRCVVDYDLDLGDLDALTAEADARWTHAVAARRELLGPDVRLPERRAMTHAGPLR